MQVLAPPSGAQGLDSMHHVMCENFTVFTPFGLIVYLVLHSQYADTLHVPPMQTQSALSMHSGQICNGVSMWPQASAEAGGTSHHARAITSGNAASLTSQRAGCPDHGDGRHAHTMTCVGIGS
jgi:hypothetical protein